MVVRAALVVLVALLLSAAAEASNFKKYNNPTWGNRWKQILQTPPHASYKHPYVTGR